MPAISRGWEPQNNPEISILCVKHVDFKRSPERENVYLRVEALTFDWTLGRQRADPTATAGSRRNGGRPACRTLWPWTGPCSWSPLWTVPCPWFCVCTRCFRRPDTSWPPRPAPRAWPRWPTAGPLPMPLILRANELFSTWRKKKMIYFMTKTSLFGARVQYNN